MKTVVRCAALVLAFLAAKPNTNAQDIHLRAGTLLHCTLAEPSFSAKSAEIGDPIICYAGTLTEFGRSVIPRGSYFTGRFADHQNPGRLTGKGWIKLEFDRLILPNAEVPVATKVVSARRFKVDAEGRILGKGHPKRDALGWLLPILWPVKLVTLPMRGPYPSLEGELPIALRLLDDAAIPQEPTVQIRLQRRQP